MRGILQGQGGKRYKTNQITGLTATVGWATANTVKLTWTNPTDVNFKGLVIRYKAGSYPTSPADGYSFYDSNDAAPVATYTVTGANIVDGTTFYFRAFAYSYIGATKVFNTSTTDAQTSAIPYRNQGTQTFTASGTFTVPYGVNAVDVFLVGGGGGGSRYPHPGSYGGGGGGGGYTKTVKTIPVTPGSNCPIVVGAGGSGGTYNANVPGGTGGTSSITVAGTTRSSSGGQGGGNGTGNNGGAGGSGGGYSCGGGSLGSTGGSNGSNGGGGGGGVGQGTTTMSFEETSGTPYAGGGGGGGKSSPSASGGYSGGGSGGSYSSWGGSGTSNTGGGGGGWGANDYNYGAGSGGSGIVIIRWGY